VGQVVARLDKRAFKKLITFSDNNVLGGEGNGIRRNVDKGLLHMDPLAVDILSQAQVEQDAGDSWGYALEAAEKVYAEARS
jgi:hypothetical protein